MGGALLVARCVLAAVFLLAAVGKFLDLAGSRRAVEEFGVPAQLARLAGPALPVAEAAAAALLLARPLAVVGAALALALLLAFIGGVAYAMSQGRAPECHCFGQIHSEPAGPSTLIRNGALAAVALFIVIGGRGSSFHALTGLDGSQVALVVVSMLAAALALAAAQLYRDRGRLTTELQRAVAAKAPAGLPRGTPAPDFTLPAVRGAPPSLAELLAAGRPTVLVFLSTRCGPCVSLLPQLGRWQEGMQENLGVAAIFSGSRVEIDELCDEHGLAGLAQENDEVFHQYGLRATPSAVRVAPDGTIAGPAAEGAPAIEALIRTMLSTGGPVRLPVHAG